MPGRPTHFLHNCLALFMGVNFGQGTCALPFSGLNNPSGTLMAVIRQCLFFVSILLVASCGFGTIPDTQAPSTLAPPPTVSAIAPAAGPATGGTAVTVTGSAFDSNASVTLGGTPCGTATIVSATQITCTTSAHAAGDVDVTVTNGDGQTGSLSGAFIYQGPPVINESSPEREPSPETPQ